MHDAAPAPRQRGSRAGVLALALALRRLPRTASCRARSAARSSTPAFRSTTSASSCRKRRRRGRCSSTTPIAPTQPGVGDEARHDVRGARAARPRLPLEDRGVSRRPLVGRRAARRPDAQGLRRPEDHRRAMAGVHRANCARKGLAAVDGDLVLDRSCFALSAARSRGVRPRAAEAVQRRAGRAARQLQVACGFAFAPDATAARSSSCAPSRRSPSVDARRGAGARRRRVRRLAAARRAARSTIAATAARSRSAARYPRGLRRARLVDRAARSPALRAARCSRRTSARRAAASPAACEGRARRAARRRSPCSNRRRSTTSCATSTSCPTT